MNTDISSLVGQRFEKIVANAHSWTFRFSDGATLSAECPWRIVTDDRIALGSIDHNQSFGHSEPIDGAEQATSLLTDSEIASVTISAKTCDLAVVLDDGARLELFNQSSGYEGWNIEFADGRRLVAMGGGQLA